MMERAENALYHGSKYDLEFLNDIYRIKQASQNQNTANTVIFTYAIDLNTDQVYTWEQREEMKPCKT